MTEKMHQPDDIVLDNVQKIMKLYFSSETKDISDWAYGPEFIALYEALFQDQYFYPEDKTRQALRCHSLWNQLRRLNKQGRIEYENSLMR